MLRTITRIMARLSLTLIALSALAILLPRLVSGIYARTRLLETGQVSPAPVAIVFGAGLWRDGSPTPVLRDRVSTAADLYFQGKVEKLLMSGDNRFVEYNEPGAMRDYALSLGVPAEDIVMDFAGRRTYDTCYRARTIFGVDHAILVTQRFHLPRAIYTCNALSVTAEGVAADRRVYRRRSLMFWTLRELPATTVAFWELHVSQPVPVMGDPEPIIGLSARRIDT